MTWILRVKVGRNWFTEVDLDEELLDYMIDLYGKVGDKCTDILVYKLDKVVKS